MKEKIEVWKYYTGFRKIYTENKETFIKLLKRKEAIHASTYYKKKSNQPIGWDIIVPKDVYDNIKKRYNAIRI